VNLVSIENLSKTLLDEALFAGVTLGIDEGEHIGLVGRNGCGKSTFLKLLRGELPPDQGTVARKRDIRVSVLEQSPQFSQDDDLLSFLYAGDSALISLVRRYQALTETAHSHSAAQHAELTHLQKAMEDAGGFELERRYISYLSELGLDNPQAPMRELSGGMLKKAAIARAMACPCDLLLLDEPTNHLDIETIEWLEAKLSSAPFAFVLVTHDRFFLDDVCDRILEIDQNRMFSYPGDFSAYLEKKAERYEQQAQAEDRRQNILRRELEWLARGPKARGGKSKSRKDKIAGLVADTPDAREDMGNFNVEAKRLGKKILEMEHVSKAYGPHVVIKDFNYIFSRGERVGIIGPNGAGKTTLIDLACGKRQADSGEVKPGDNTVFAYFNQDTSGINKALTVIEFMREKADRVQMPDGVSLSAEQFLERFLFTRAVFNHQLSRLSGGELRRLMLIRLLASGCNFLLLDEPTNDFDVGTIALLEDFLCSYPACLMVVSHDRAFLDRVAEHLFVLDGAGGVSEFPGSYTEYRERKDEEAEAERQRRKEAVKPASAAAAKPSLEAGTSSADPGQAEKPAKLSFKERRELDTLMPEIEALEAEKAALEAFFSVPNPDPADLTQKNKRYAEIQPLIDQKTSRWEELAAREVI
jgi:ATP-binding cassette subfamily F protein uup